MPIRPVSGIPPVAGSVAAIRSPPATRREGWGLQVTRPAIVTPVTRRNDLLQCPLFQERPAGSAEGVNRRTVAMTQPTQPATAHPHWDTVAIVGVGLIGGSIGIDLLRQKLARHVVGIGRREESLHEARRVGACTSTTLDLPQGLADAQLIIVCTPVGRIAQDVQTAAGFAKSNALITDVGSTKGTIVGELDRELPHEAHYVGSHPLAGGEKTGPSAAVPGSSGTQCRGHARAR